MIIRILICFLFTSMSFSQTSFLNVDLSSIQSDIKLESVNLIKEESNNSYFIILEEKKKTHVLKYDSNKTLKGSITSKIYKQKFKTTICHVAEDDKLLLLQKYLNRNRLTFIKYNFDTNEIEEEELEIMGRSERYVKSYVYSDRCIVFTVDKSNGLLKKWQFFIDGNYNVEDYSMKDLFNKANVPYKFMDNLLFKSRGSSGTLLLTKVNNKIPNNLEITTDTNKMYESENSITWTFDHGIDYTLVFQFAAPDFKPILRTIKKPEPQKSNGSRSNSYVFEDNIAQVVSNDDELLIEIKKLNTPSKIVNSFKVEKDEQINFKNSPILQEGSAMYFGKTRKMEKASKLLKKMSTEDNGISIYKNNEKYQMTVGGTRTQSSGGAPMMISGPPSMPSGQFRPVVGGSAPVIYAYGMHTHNGSTRIECLFDLDFNHIEGEIEENVFDRVDGYRNIEGDLEIETMTYLDDKLILGYWKPDEMRYYFKGF